MKIHALVLSIIICVLASIRPLSLGYDTQAYIDVLNTHWLGVPVLSPDIIFNAYTVTYSNFIPAGGASERGYFVVLALVQSILFYKILKNRSLIQSIVMTAGFGPLIFFDIVRQGLAMLLAGAIVSCNSKKTLIKFFPLLIHSSGFVLLTMMRYKVFSLKTLLAVILFALIGYLFLYEGAYNRYLYYISNDNYLGGVETKIIYELPYKITILNIIVVIIFLFGNILGILDRKQILFLLFFYLLGILMPIFFRLYIFYIFLLFCEKNILLFKNRNIFIQVFSLLMVIVVLNFAFKTNIENLNDLL